jgi:predicted ATPase
MNAKHITEISIENFRGFKKLELSGLKAVNLIVGQNNAGKTSLLEALAILAEPSQVARMPELLRAKSGDVNKRYFRWLVRDSEGVDQAVLRGSGGRFSNELVLNKSVPRVENGSTERIHQSSHLYATARTPVNHLRVRVISVHHSTPSDLVKSFGNAVRKREGEDLVHSILKAVDPRILRVRVDPVEEGNIISVDIGLTESIPLSQVGQGVYRLVEVLSDLIGETPQICIIDEIENGIHHTVLKQIWRGLAEISSKLGVQVFATTHSDECLEAADQVFFSEDPANKREFALIQLMRVKGDVVGRVLDEAKVDAALENEIELR